MDPLTLAEAIDGALAPLVAAARAVAEAPDAFRIRRAVSLAALLLGSAGEGVERGEAAESCEPVDAVGEA